MNYGRVRNSGCLMSEMQNMSILNGNMKISSKYMQEKWLKNAK